MSKYSVFVVVDVFRCFFQVATHTKVTVASAVKAHSTTAFTTSLGLRNDTANFTLIWHSDFLHAFGLQ